MKTFFTRYLSHLTLLALVLLAVLKYILGGCRLWLCAAFVGIVTGYMILSDILQKPGKNNDKTP